MKVLAALVFIFGIFSPAFADNKSVKKCLADLSTIKDRTHAKTKSEECLNLATPLRDSVHLFSRALYLSALSAKTQLDPSENYYEHVYNEIFPYYQKNIQNFIVPNELKVLDSEELSSVYESNLWVAFYSFLISPNLNPKNTTLQVFDELVKRNLTTQKQIQDAYMIAIRYRDWNRARQILSKWPNVEPKELPTDLGDSTVGAPDLRYYEVFTLQKLFSVRQTDLVEIGKMAELYPAFKINPVVNSWAWWKSEIKTNAMPRFLFLVNGKGKYSFMGGGGVVENFCKGIHSIGVNPPAGCKTYE